ncbi:hypothetical protein BELL_0297g00100 [Botrytis elliptica]|uniref:Uncharacterized protein n=1 Tax=Botrytis elliptica TaxID=278938 RepID=A0A4Z1JKQ7_9HELO|nr:hypothetical protein EAE99_009530 [Botrytis elliptica]TGO74245.1 hypothetical protein BELL_0297g00100 [Botrytis elliptica]
MSATYYLQSHERLRKEELTRAREREWHHNSIRKHQNWNDIRFQLSPQYGKFMHYKNFQIQRQVEIDYLAEQAKELYLKQQDPEWQAEQAKLKRREEYRRYVVQNDLVHCMTLEEKFERKITRARERKAAKYQENLQRYLAECDRQDRQDREDKLAYQAIGAFALLSVGVILFSFFC